DRPQLGGTWPDAQLRRDPGQSDREHDHLRQLSLVHGMAGLRSLGGDQQDSAAQLRRRAEAWSGAVGGVRDAAQRPAELNSGAGEAELASGAAGRSRRRDDDRRQLAKWCLQQFVAELLQAHGSQSQHARMEGLEVERRSLARAQLGAQGEALTLAQLVADRLRRPAQVAVDLADHELARVVAVRQGELESPLRSPATTGMLLAGGDLELEVHADVD